ncbi:MAG: hypothetical protein OER88_02835 [Planctomycetota bacterium]|nr:hypothetical protein [Planctomycetota bacterium]
MNRALGLSGASLTLFAPGVWLGFGLDKAEPTAPKPAPAPTHSAIGATVGGPAFATEGIAPGAGPRHPGRRIERGVTARGQGAEPAERVLAAYGGSNG